ncbi:hypothetical protein SDC9_163740 [bioreactor metagenome]|uniref:Glycoside hydrolase family 2 domain-containing protein n=1 Tax=bioreactor metagenome TaxID=1076179 RepID=A0A645FR80_9ZZZZ
MEAVAYDAFGKECGRTKLATLSEKPAIRIIPEETNVKPGDICYLNIALADAEGNVECNADERLTCEVEGGELLAFGSANPRTEETYRSGSFTTYYGRAQAIVKAGHSGRLSITVSGGSYQPETAVLTVE